ncbi:MAG TPA: TraB/GumN family protein [Rhodanobacteraceae bacterium]
MKMHLRWIPILAMAAAVTLAGCAATRPAATPQAPTTTLWKVTSAHRTLYLTGTTLPTYPLPQVMQNAFAASGSVVFESDPGVDKAKVAKLRPKIVAIVRKYGRFPAGQKLTDKLTPAQLKLVKQAILKVGMPFSPANPVRPWLVATMLQGKSMAMTLKKMGAKQSDLLNQHLARKAIARKMPIIPLQSAVGIMRMLATFPDKLQVSWLMVQAKAATEPFDMKKAKRDQQAWRTGDTAYFTKQIRKKFKGKPELYKAAVSNRNRTWVDKLEAMLAKPGKPIFVSVGSGHLVGPDNMRDLLRADGYTVTQL